MGFKSDGAQQLLGASVITTGQATVTTVAASLVAANAARRSVTIVKHGGGDVFLGATAAVTSATGLLFAGGKGAALGLDTSDEVFAVMGAGSVVVSFLELLES